MLDWTMARASKLDRVYPRLDCAADCVFRERRE